MTDREAEWAALVRAIFGAMNRPACCVPGCDLDVPGRPNCNCYMEAELIAEEVRPFLAASPPPVSGEIVDVKPHPFIEGAHEAQERVLQGRDGGCRQGAPGCRMSRATLVLSDDITRQRAARWVQIAPPNTRLEFKEPSRSLPQNARLWVMLTAVARQLPWHGVKLSADDWKLIFLDALKAEMRLVPNLNGNGFVNLGRSSSDLSKDEFSQLLDLISAFAAEHGVDLGQEAA